MQTVFILWRRDVHVCACLSAWDRLVAVKGLWGRPADVSRWVWPPKSLIKLLWTLLLQEEPLLWEGVSFVVVMQIFVLNPG